MKAVDHIANSLAVATKLLLLSLELVALAAMPTRSDNAAAQKQRTAAILHGFDAVRLELGVG